MAQLPVIFLSAWSLYSTVNIITPPVIANVAIGTKQEVAPQAPAGSGYVQLNLKLASTSVHTSFPNQAVLS